MMNKIKIFFDGNCIVCDTEISHYSRMRPDIFELVNISDPKFNAAQFGLNAKAVNEHMHVLTETGELKVGVDAFSYIWSKLPRYAWASVVIQLPGVSSLSRFGYKIFAKYRHLLPKKK